MTRATQASLPPFNTAPAPTAPCKCLMSTLVGGSAVLFLFCDHDDRKCSPPLCFPLQFRIRVLIFYSHPNEDVHVKLFHVKTGLFLKRAAGKM